MEKNTDKFEVSRELLESFIAKSMSQEEIAQELTRLGGRKCSNATVRMLCKHYNINLRKRTRQFFIPVLEEDNNLEIKEDNQEVINDTNKNEYQRELFPEETTMFAEDNNSIL